MSKLIHPLERLVETIYYKGVKFEIVERPDVIWVGCVDYADNNTDESDINSTLKRFQELVGVSEIKEKVNPDWGAALSINYNVEKPCGLMFANESYSKEQDERFDLFTQPGGLWLRVSCTETADQILFGRKAQGSFEYFSPCSEAAVENGYLQNPNINIAIEYHCHAEYNQPNHTNYAYIPIIKN